MDMSATETDDITQNKCIKNLIHFSAATLYPAKTPRYSNTSSAEKAEVRGNSLYQIKLSLHGNQSILNRMNFKICNAQLSTNILALRDKQNLRICDSVIRLVHY